MIIEKHKINCKRKDKDYKKITNKNKKILQLKIKKKYKKYKKKQSL